MSRLNSYSNYYRYLTTVLLSLSKTYITATAMSRQLQQLPVPDNCIGIVVQDVHYGNSHV
jgi:hypothetical protein